MLTFQIVDLIESVLAHISDENAVVTALEVLAQPGLDIAGDVVGIGSNSNTPAYANSILARLKAVKEHSAAISPRKFYASLPILEKSLRDFQSQLPLPSNYVESIVADVDAFAGLFDSYLTNSNAENAAYLVHSASGVAQRLKDFCGSLKLFGGLIERLPPQHDDNSVLSIVLPGAFNLREFIATLRALESMYSELCQLVNISEVDYPLQIAKIESGSLLAKVAGSAFVIGLMTQFIQSGATYAYNNYTVEGRIKAIPTKVESLDKVIELTKKLKEAGVDTSDIEGHVAKSAHAIASDLNTLIEGHPSIILNGLEISVASEAAHGQISSNNVPKLGGQTSP